MNRVYWEVVGIGREPTVVGEFDDTGAGEEWVVGWVGIAVEEIGDFVDSANGIDGDIAWGHNSNPPP